MTITKLLSGELADYREGPPPRRAAALIDGAAVEAELCKELACPMCGNSGLTYRPFHQPHTGSWRSFAECPKCGHAEEL